MKAGIPKQFLLLQGKPLLMHTIRAFFHPADPLPIVLALPEEHLGTWNDLCRLHNFNLPHTVVSGGTSRFGSVKKALACIPDEGFVAVHDGARPLVTPELIERCFTEAEVFENAVPSIPVLESIRETNTETSRPIDRSHLRIIQTPQVFSVHVLKEAYCSAPGDDYGDDATVAEMHGHSIHLFDGDPRNIKVTVAADLELAGLILESRQTKTR